MLLKLLIWILLIIVLISIYFFSSRSQLIPVVKKELSFVEKSIDKKLPISPLTFRIELDLNDRFDEFIVHEEWKSERIVAMEYEDSNDEDPKLILLLSTIRSNSRSNENLCYLYLQIWADKYRLKSSRIISLKSSLKLNRCPQWIDSHLIKATNNRWNFILKMIELDKEKKSTFYFFDSLMNPSFISMKSSSIGVPLVKDDQLYLIESIQPLKILRCSKEKKFCEKVFDSKSTIDEEKNYLSPATGSLPYKNHFIGFVESRTSVDQCEDLIRCHLMILTFNNDEIFVNYLSDVLPMDDLPLFHSRLFPSFNNRSDECFGHIRTIRCQSIVRLYRKIDRLDLVVSIDDNSTYLIRIDRLRKIDEKIKEKSPSNRWISSIRSKTLNYHRTKIEMKKNLWKRFEIEEEFQRRKVIKDIISSPTNPNIRLASNALAHHLTSWINYDRVQFGLIGRYLKSIEGKSRLYSNLIIDAGGNHGTYAFFAAARFNQHVLIFEVLPKYWIVIRESIRLNENFPRLIQLYPFGISDRFGIWNVLPDDGTTKLNSLSSMKSPSMEEYLESISLINDSTRISAYSFDDFIVQKISLLKIDIEGFEIRALKGLERTLKRFRIGAILIELAPNRWESNGITIDEGIFYLNLISEIGTFSNYLIGTKDLHCPTMNMTIIDGLIPFANLSMINLTNETIEMAENIHQIFNWTMLIKQMENHHWSCNVWMEKIVV